MAILPIIIAPDPRLKAVCQPVERIDDALRRLMDDMLETMYQAPGVGLAAPQVGVPSRVVVVDISGPDRQSEPYRLVNPELVRVSDELVSYEEGCLSLPEHYADVTRPERARIRYLDDDNKTREIDVEGMLATCMQHEMDHLDGVLFVDHLSNVKRGMILRKLAKSKRAEAHA